MRPWPLVMGIMKRTKVGRTEMMPVHANARPEGERAMRKSMFHVPAWLECPPAGAL